jgi:hypothetical protein
MINNLLLAFNLVWPQISGAEQLPAFSLGTVLVWKSENRGNEYDFVIRLAKHSPSRYFEWENQTTQGTVLLKKSAVENARKYSSYRLFQAGADLESADETCYWFSRGLFAELKSAGKGYFMLDAIKTHLEQQAVENISVLVNQEEKKLVTLKFRDNRGGEWWILDDVENPLVVKRRLNSWQEQLASVRTDRPNSLRWIKGARLRSLNNLP